MGKNVSVEDEAKYVLKVENTAGKTETTSNVIVLIPPSFEKALSDKTLLENGDLNLEVTAVGKPAPTLRWQKDSADLKPDKRIKVTKKGGVSSVAIKKVESTDAGGFQCFAQNEAGETTTHATVLVNSKPQVLKKLKDITVKEEETLVLEAQFKGFPDPDVTWFKDDELLPVGYIKKEDNNHDFHIKNAKLETSGVYSAIAKNLVGDCKTSARVKVLKAPYFEKSLSDVTIVEKQPLKLYAEIHGFPEPEVEWMKDGKTLSAKKSGSEKIVL